MVSHPLCLPLESSPKNVPQVPTRWGAPGRLPILATSPLPAWQPHPVTLPERETTILPALSGCRSVPVTAMSRLSNY